LNAQKNHHKSGRSVDAAADVATQFEKFWIKNFQYLLFLYFYSYFRGQSNGPKVLNGLKTSKGENGATPNPKGSKPSKGPKGPKGPKRPKNHTTEITESVTHVSFTDDFTRNGHVAVHGDRNRNWTHHSKQWSLNILNLTKLIILMEKKTLNTNTI